MRPSKMVDALEPSPAQEHAALFLDYLYVKVGKDARPFDARTLKTGSVELFWMTPGLNRIRIVITAEGDLSFEYIGTSGNLTESGKSADGLSEAALDKVRKF